MRVCYCQSHVFFFLCRFEEKTETDILMLKFEGGEQTSVSAVEMSHNVGPPSDWVVMVTGFRGSTVTITVTSFHSDMVSR